jgi:ankyrin repeat protein
MHAVQHHQRPAVELLLAAGASPVAADNEGTTPLQAAQAAGERVIIEALQRYGAR